MKTGVIILWDVNKIPFLGLSKIMPELAVRTSLL
jgi:hypothetical protein